MKWSADSIRWYDVASETPITTTFLPWLRKRLTSGIKSPSPVTSTYVSTCGWLCKKSEHSTASITSMELVRRFWDLPPGK